ncbi:MAG: hypothetical protein ED556_11850 [Winogradskyella sp.]|uniref:hypothetical protein n=1 Tax=Winogradskyella sp. TaxID=1883156 RepID=UPI000F3AE311|nr:hypothetical protein [Winogradskyella sp.]RNC84146.1 MAG: hypothetical protein ED556_11850 [Winogradskyella sp.]
MAKKQDQTASFMVRFNQRIFEEDGEPKVQWRGKISHVQGGSDANFSDFNDALIFMQQKLAELTNEATEGESEERREGILKKSFSMWKTMKEVGPKMIMETIKDPKKQISNIQDQIQDQISNISEEISQKVQIDHWRNASRADFHDIQSAINALSKDIKALSAKVDKLKKK